MKLRKLSGILALLSLGACYHATIETGLQPSSETIAQPWALSFVYGLVPPPTVQTAAKCKNGVAKVETQMSFLNGLVGSLTFGLFTPMDIKVTCSTGQRASVDGAAQIQVGADVQAAVQQAAERTIRSGAPVYLMF